MKFLVVDDSNIARKRLNSYLNELNYIVLGEAIDGLDAIDKFILLKPSIVTLDSEMPNLNGIDTAKRLLEINPNVKIMLITSIIDKKEIINAYRIGIKKVITKPFSMEKLKESIEEIKG
ncbi:response regulator [Halarcobacter sp.]|uniref:response regulator n=1 Tax=Halarcobacter sp. TaxID=2321133 RepID=UPI0029F5A889|nr:response regulator [Halarcobacter sp.]